MKVNPESIFKWVLTMSTGSHFKNNLNKLFPTNPTCKQKTIKTKLIQINGNRHPMKLCETSVFVQNFLLLKIHIKTRYSWRQFTIPIKVQTRLRIRKKKATISCKLPIYGESFEVVFWSASRLLDICSYCWVSFGKCSSALTSLFELNKFCREVKITVL